MPDCTDMLAERGSGYWELGIKNPRSLGREKLIERITQYVAKSRGILDNGS